MQVRKTKPTQSLQDFRNDLIAVARKYNSLPPQHLLSMTAHFVGTLAAMQDKRVIKAAEVQHLITANIMAGNRETVEQIITERAGKQSFKELLGEEETDE